MKLEDAIVQPMPATGPVEIDIKKVARTFGFSVISYIPASKVVDSPEKYFLSNRRAGIKVMLRADDAQEIIKKLQLVEIPTFIFRGSNFMTKKRAERHYGSE